LLHRNLILKIFTGCPRVTGDEDDGADMDDFVDEFKIKSPGKAEENRPSDLNSVGQKNQMSIL
jgi:hypothetical protein